jgi:hypothetical protein
MLFTSNYPTSPLPAISIDFAPIEEPVKEPQSPFASFVFASSTEHDAKSPRSFHLLPPPAVSPRVAEARQLQKQHQQAAAAGLEQVRFESMIQATRERSAIAKKQLDLRKEVALKAHQTKQAERRALFLSKLVALPSPTATSTPVTPPESPAVFHFTLPSPGLVSPLALFETLDLDSANATIRIEHVDFRARAKKDAEAMAAITRNVKQSMEINGLSGNYQAPVKSMREAKTLPSLDQISARLNSTTNVTTHRAPTTGSRLPAFLRSRAPASVAPVPVPTASPALSARSDDTIRPVGRLPFAPVSRPPVARKVPGPPMSTTRSAMFKPVTIPRSTALTLENLELLDKRAERGKVMVDRIKRRVSAPAELNSRPDNHPILKVRGGF